MASTSTADAGYDRALTRFLAAFADHDEQWAGGMHAKVAARLVDLARPAPGHACLELGGGPADVADALCDAVGPSGSVVSVHVAKGSPESHRSTRPSNLHVMTMSGGEVIFRDGTFDVVVLSRSIAYAADPGAVIAEAIRTLKPGGRLALFCRRRALATEAERAFLGELAALVHEQPVVVPERFLTYPGLADRDQLESVLVDAGLEQVTFGDVVTGGRAVTVGAFELEMMRCWPGARIVLEALGGMKRRQFDGRIAAAMRVLGGEALRYHHPYLLATGIRGSAARP